MKDLPAITGFQLIRLLERGGWTPARKARHGQTFRKYFASEKRTRVTVAPRTRAALPPGTLAGILGVKQTGLGRDGLIRLIEKHGLR